MSEIRLGKIHLRWCDSCNVPVLEQSRCDVCGGKTREVSLTPPGDARPAFEHDIVRIRQLVDHQFGRGTGSSVLPEGRIVLLNKVPDIDRMDEVIVDGHVVGAVRFDILRGDRFILRPRSALAIAHKVQHGWVKIDSGAVEPIRKRSASTLAIGVLDCDPGIWPGMEILVLDPEGNPVSVGTSKMSSSEIMAHKRGTAVKTRWVVDTELKAEERKSASWDDVIAANKEVISRRASEAKKFIARVVEEHRLPVAVSYSGGKDSLATLLLVLESGIKPKLLFVDTGLEFNETKRNVLAAAEKLDLELIVESAGDSFWRNVERFGPPAKDFRWCCKTCKLGPATRLIQKNFPGGVLSFIGQRAYESEQRARKGSIWRNPWTPNQLGASPIQKWTALHVWIYLMSRGAKPNPLYEQGLERIGCFMCPATDLAELRIVRKLSSEYKRWQEFLNAYAVRTGKPASWLEYDLWRWKRVPKSVIEEIGLSLEQISDKAESDHAPLEFRSTSGYSPCVEGLSMEGIFSKRLPMDRVTNMLNIVGDVTTSPDGNIAEVKRMTVFAEGPVMIRAKDEQELRTKASQLREIVFRAVNCAGCGICLARCPNEALALNGRVSVIEAKCTHCGSCLGPCPVVAFREEELDV
ncbi:MAG: phosphoadenosine phosphosulfate reductase domain-containing protein [Thermoplasmata archaeon]